MLQKKHKPEEIVSKLWQVGVVVSKGQSVAEAVRSISVTPFTYGLWRKEFGRLKTGQVKRLKALAKENERLRTAVSDLMLEKLILAEAARGNIQAPPAAVAASSTSGRRSRSRNGSPARFSGQHRSTQRKVPRGRSDEEALTADIIALGREYGRYGYRRITALLREAGWTVNVKRVERSWRREGLKVPAKPPKKGRLWLSDGSCIPGRSSCDKPVKHDKRRTKRRHRIENMFGRLKDWRRVAMHFDRCPIEFLSAIALPATIMFWLSVLRVAKPGLRPALPAWMVRSQPKSRSTPTCRSCTAARWRRLMTSSQTRTPVPKPWTSSAA